MIQASTLLKYIFERLISTLLHQAFRKIKISTHPSVSPRGSRKVSVTMQNLELESFEVRWARKKCCNKLKQHKDYSSNWHKFAAELYRLDAEYESVESEKNVASTAEDDECMWTRWTRSTELLDRRVKQGAYASERALHLKQADLISARSGLSLSPPGMALPDPSTGRYADFSPNDSPETSALPCNSISSPLSCRGHSVQSRLRTRLVDAYNVAHPDPLKSGSLWCPFTGTYSNKGAMVAAYLVPVEPRAESIEALFGKSKSKELMSPRNCIIVSMQVQERLNKALLAIVADVSDIRDSSIIESWRRSRPKKYKIRVLNSEHPLMQFEIPETEKPFTSLDGRPIETEE